jgi:hypothetical protein
MRKNAARLIRKTELPLHRATGKNIISLPYGKDFESLKDIRLFGNIALNSTGEHKGIGEKEGDTYKIKLRVHGRNAISGEEFASIHKNAGVNATSSESGGIYTFTPNVSRNGITVLGNSHICFKENTVYTLAARISFSSAPKNGKSIGLAFLYSDYTKERIKVTSNSSTLYFAASSASGKTLIGLVADAEDSGAIGIYTKEFGIFEGEFSSYDEAFSSYVGQTTSINLRKPLHKIGNFSDFLDLSACRAHYFTESCALGKDISPAESEYRGAFKFELPRVGVTSSSIYSLYEQLPFSGIVSGRRGIAFSEDGKYIYYRPSGSTQSLEEITDKLARSPVYIVYKAATEEISETEISYSLYDEGTTIEIVSKVKPSMFYAEYI